MSLLEAAKALAKGSPWDNLPNGMGRRCRFCIPRSSIQYAGEHQPDCPWLQMPQIVAALEDAERVKIERDAYKSMAEGNGMRLISVTPR